MKKYRFLQDFLGMKKGDIYEFDVEVEVYMGPLIEAGIIEEVKPKPKNRFLLKAEDMEVGKRYWSINSGNLVYDFEWSGIEYELRMLENNNVFTTQEEAENQVKRNEAVAKYLKCVARHNEARKFEAKFDGTQHNYCFHLFSGEVRVDSFISVQNHPADYYFHSHDAEAIHKELGDECLKLVFGGK